LAFHHPSIRSPPAVALGSQRRATIRWAGAVDQNAEESGSDLSTWLLHHPSIRSPPAVALGSQRCATIRWAGAGRCGGCAVARSAPPSTGPAPAVVLLRAARHHPLGRHRPSCSTRCASPSTGPAPAVALRARSCVAIRRPRAWGSEPRSPSNGPATPLPRRAAHHHPQAVALGALRNTIRRLLALHEDRLCCPKVGLITSKAWN
jgi:hypothetical protein